MIPKTETLSEIHYRGWTKQNHRDLESAGPSLPAMREIAFDVIKFLPHGLHFIVGSITTGGFGSVKDNMRLFKRTIEYLYENEGLNIFSQMPFERGMIEYHRQWTLAHPDEYCWPILLEFYAPLFATGRFEMFHFMHGYLSSTGARWKHEQAVLHGIKKHYLSRKLARELSLGLINVSVS